MSLSPQFHETAAPVAAGAVSCVIGFNWHAALGVAGQIIGVVSGTASLAWVVYQWWRSHKK